MTYQFKSTYIATATALLLNLPLVGEIHNPNLTPAHFHDFEPLADASKPVLEALAPTVHASASPETVFSLLTEVATHLIESAKPLDRDFAKIVEKEFWNLLQ